MGREEINLLSLTLCYCRTRKIQSTHLVVSVSDGDERANEGGGEIGGGEEKHLAREPDCLKALDLEENNKLTPLRNIDIIEP